MYFFIGHRRVKQEGGICDKFTLMTAFGFLSGAIARGFYMILDCYLMTDIFAHKKAYLAIGIAFAVGVPIMRLFILHLDPSPFLNVFECNL